MAGTENFKPYRYSVLFYLAWFIYLPCYLILKQTEVALFFNTQYLFSVAQFISLFLIICKVVLEPYNLKRLIIIVLIAIFVLLVTLKSKSSTPGLLFIFLLGSKGISNKKFLRIDYNIKLFILIFVILMSLLGVLPNYTSLINGNFKQSLGFYHPNILGMIATTLALEKMYLDDFKITIKSGGIITLLIFIAYFISGSRTSVFVFLFIFAIKSLMQILNNPFRIKILNYIFILAPSLLSVLSFAIVNLYSKGNSIAIALNRILTTRIRFGYQFARKYGLNLLGTDIEIIGTRIGIDLGISTQILDMGYLRVGINFGLAALVIFCIILTMIQIRAVSTKDTKLLLCSTFFILVGFSETYFINIAFNFVLILYFSSIYNDQEL